MASLELRPRGREASATTQASTSTAGRHPALTFVEERAEYWLLRDLERRWPRVVGDVRELLRQWPEADRFAGRGASMGDVMADSRMLAAAVRHRFASAPRWALIAACDQIAVETADGYDAIQRAVRAAGIPLAAGAGVAATAAALEALGLLQSCLREHLGRMATETALTEA